MGIGFLKVLADVGVGLYKGYQQRRSASKAADQQVNSAQAAIDTSQEHFNSIKDNLAPYMEGGLKAERLRHEFLGLSGAEAEQAAIDSVANGSQFKEITQQGENAILQNASATGGLRGGNTQGVLAQYRPKMLNDLINQRFDKLSGLSESGRLSAIAQGNAGIETSRDIGGYLTQQGAARAGQALARGAANIGVADSISGGGGGIAGLDQIAKGKI